MNKQTDVNELVREARARQSGDDEGLHVRNAVLWIDVSVVVFVIICAAVTLTVVFRWF